jgi:hypothetical protein
MDQVGLREELQHGHVEVFADARHALAQDRRGIDERSTPAAAAVDQEAVVDAGERLHGIDVGDHAGRRLGLAHGDDVAGGEPVQDVDVTRATDGLRGLREDVVGVGVAGVGQVAVPLGIPLLEGLDLDPRDRQHPATLDARALRGHTDVGRAVLQ